MPPDPAGGDHGGAGDEPDQHRGQDPGARPRRREGPRPPVGLQGQHPGHLGGQRRPGNQQQTIEQIVLYVRMR